MNRTSNLSLVAFLAALTALEMAAPVASQPTPLTVESRLSRLAETLKSRIDRLPETPELPGETDIVAQWLKTRGGGFLNRPGGGGFLNRRPWRNGWGDGGGFLNRR